MPKWGPDIMSVVTIARKITVKTALRNTKQAGPSFSSLELGFA